MRRAVIGLDASLTCFGMCTISAEGGVYLKHWGTDTEGTVRERVGRLRRMAIPAAEACKRHAPYLVLIEGPAFGSKGKGSIERYMARGVLLDKIEGFPDYIVEVPPSTLKKFATGKGACDKALVVSELSTRYRQSFEVDDEADAFALAKIGAVVAGYDQPQTKFQEEAAAVVKALLQQEIDS